MYPTFPPFVTLTFHPGFHPSGVTFSRYATDLGLFLRFCVCWKGFRTLKYGICSIFCACKPLLSHASCSSSPLTKRFKSTCTMGDAIHWVQASISGTRSEVLNMRINTKKWLYFDNARIKASFWYELSRYRFTRTTVSLYEGRKYSKYTYV